MNKKIYTYDSWVWQDNNGCEWIILPRHANCQPGQIIYSRGQHFLLINKKSNPHIKGQNIWIFKIMESIPQKPNKLLQWFQPKTFKMKLVFKGDQTEAKRFRAYVLNVFKWYKDFHPNTSIIGGFNE